MFAGCLDSFDARGAMVVFFGGGGRVPWVARTRVAPGFEYLVRWSGFNEEADSWEPVDGLPQDMVAEFDAALRGSRGAKRACRM